MADIVGLEKGTHSLWNPDGLIHKITKITVPSHCHVHRCLLLVPQHHICSVVTLDDAGCSSVGHQKLQSWVSTALGSPPLKTMVPLRLGACDSASPSSLAAGVRAAARMRTASLRVTCFHKRALGDSPFLLWPQQPHEQASWAGTRMHGAMECLVSTFFHVARGQSCVLGLDCCPLMIVS